MNKLVLAVDFNLQVFPQKVSFNNEESLIQLNLLKLS